MHPLISQGGYPKIKLQAAALMTAMAFVFFFGFELLSTHHSNGCDPGLARFHALQSDPAAQIKPSHALVDNEWDQPDNSFLGCSLTYITYYLMGFDNHALYLETNQIYVANGWSESPPFPPTVHVNFEGHDKTGAYGHATAIISEELFWVEVVLNDQGGAWDAKP